MHKILRYIYPLWNRLKGKPLHPHLYWSTKIFILALPHAKHKERDLNSRQDNRPGKPLRIYQTKGVGVSPPILNLVFLNSRNRLRGSTMKAQGWAQGWPKIKKGNTELSLIGTRTFFASTRKKNTEMRKARKHRVGNSNFTSFWLA